MVWNNYLSNIVSAELLANVSVCTDFLLVREKPDLCSQPFDTDEIATFIKYIWFQTVTSWCFYVYFFYLLFYNLIIQFIMLLKPVIVGRHCRSPK